MYRPNYNLVINTSIKASAKNPIISSFANSIQIGAGVLYMDRTSNEKGGVIIYSGLAVSKSIGAGAKSNMLPVKLTT